MQRYWLKIALGAALVFGLGMGVIALVRSSIGELRALAESDRPIGIPLAILPFRVDGSPIGDVRRLELLRSSPSKVTGVRLMVRLNDSSEAARLRDCRLTLHERSALGGRDGFRCEGPGDSSTPAVKRIGEVVFEPGGVVRAIFVPADRAAAWRDYDTASVRAELEKLRAQGLADSAARVRIRADSERAIIEVQGDSGERLVRIQADSHGALMHIRNRAGKSLFRMRADSNGASISVLEDSVAHPR